MRRHIVIGAGVVAALALVAVVANVVSLESEIEGQTDGPVISLGRDWNAYPAAEVTGRLKLVEDCLLLGDSVVFWPHETAWDGDGQAVVFGGDFKGSAYASVGEVFTGGGGTYSEDNVKDLEGLGADAVVRCMRENDTDAVLVAYPSG